MPRNPSPAQIAAARANGARSRGPLSAAGKAKCSLNATTHGITARATCLPTENPEVFKALFDALIEEFQPATTAELLCVEEMAAAKWKIRRLWNLETATLSAGLDSTPPSADPHARTSAAWKESQTQLDSYARHDSRLHHQYRRNLAQLEHLQLLRASMPVDPVMEPEPLPFLQNEPEPPPPTFPDGEPAEPIDPPWASIAHLLVPPADPIDQSAQNEPKNLSCFADWTGAEPPPQARPAAGRPRSTHRRPAFGTLDSPRPGCRSSQRLSSRGRRLRG